MKIKEKQNKLSKDAVQWRNATLVTAIVLSTFIVLLIGGILYYDYYDTCEENGQEDIKKALAEIVTYMDLVEGENGFFVMIETEQFGDQIVAFNKTYIEHEGYKIYQKR